MENLLIVLYNILKDTNAIGNPVSFKRQNRITFVKRSAQIKFELNQFSEFVFVQLCLQ